MIRVEAVHKFYGRIWAVRGVSLEIPPGQITGLLGPNGAGKTSVIRMMVGAIVPDSGRILVGGRDTAEGSGNWRRGIGYLPEQAPLYPEMRVGRFLEFRARLFGMDRRERRLAVGEAMERCRVAEVARRRIGGLSKGFKQRVGVAAALVHRPGVVILDEPTNGLDPSQIGEMRSLVRDLVGGLGRERTMVVCSHILPEVERLCDRVAIIAGGRVRAEGTVAELTGSSGGGMDLEVRGEGEEGAMSVGALERALGGLPGVRGVARVVLDEGSRAGGWVGLRVELGVEAGVEAGVDVRELVAGVVGAWARLGGEGAGPRVRELHRRRGTLEEVFARVMDGGGRAGA